MMLFSAFVPPQKGWDVLEGCLCWMRWLLPGCAQISARSGALPYTSLHPRSLSVVQDAADSWEEEGFHTSLPALCRRYPNDPA